MTTLGQYWKVRDDTCADFVEQLKDLIRVQTFHELNQDTLEEIFKMNEQKSFLPLFNDRVRTLQEMSDFEIKQTNDPEFVEYCYRGVFIRHPKDRQFTVKDISAACDPENTTVKVFYSTEDGSTDLSIISGNVEILIGKNEWYLYVAREIWNAFASNYLDKNLADSYK